MKRSKHGLLVFSPKKTLIGGFRDEWVKVKVTILTMKQTVSEIQILYMVQGTLPTEVGSEKSGKEQLSTTLL